jgi:hypothetical protein
LDVDYIITESSRASTSQKEAIKVCNSEGSWSYYVSMVESDDTLAVEMHDSQNNINVLAWWPTGQSQFK